MVARILTGKSIRGLLQYNESKVQSGDATLILANRFGLEIEQLELRYKQARFEHLTKLNSRVKTNAVHVMLNFDRSDCIDLERFQKIAVDYMERIGFEEQPFLVYQHEDASHPHIHIVTTNIRPDASRIDMHNIGKTLSEEARKSIENEYELVKAEGQEKNQQTMPVRIDAAVYGEKPTKRSIYNVVTAVLRDYKFTSFPEFNAALGAFNVTADRGLKDSTMYEKGGLVYSIVDQDGQRIGIPFKASALAGKPLLKVVESKYERNKIRRELYTESIKNKIREVINRSGPIDKTQFAERLAEKGVTIVFRQSEKGPIYGLTYVDHQNRCVFNGSDLGKDFSAKVILQSFQASIQNVNPEATPGIKRSNREIEKAPEIPSHSGVVEQGSKTGLLDVLLQEDIANGTFQGTPLRKKRRKKGKSKHQNLGNKF